MCNRISSFSTIDGFLKAGGTLLDIVGETGRFWAMLPIDAMAAVVFVYLALRK